jgi:catechol 2,3-dioxygenase-like lactoylglutathione lyase family enzyme
VSQHIASLAIIVREYDEAIKWYCEILGFRLVEDTVLTDTKRWVRVAPAESRDFSLLLARAVTPEQSSRIGNQTGGRVFLFLNTDDFWRDYDALSRKGVVFRRSPVEESYGTVAVFEDLYGNLWDLIQPRVAAP